MPAYPSHVLAELDGGRYGNCIERDVGIKRTTAIRLLLSLDEMPERPAGFEPTNAPEEPDEDEDEEEREPEPEPEPAAEWPNEEDDAILEDAITSIVAPDPSAIIDRLTMMQSLAIGVMMDVADLAASRMGEGQDGGVTAMRLADTLEENQRLRRGIRDLEETLRAKVNETAMVRKALKQAQANVEAFRTGARVNDAGFKALDRFMREVPRTRGNGA